MPDKGFMALDRSHNRARKTFLQLLGVTSKSYNISIPDLTRPIPLSQRGRFAAMERPIGKIVAGRIVHIDPE